MPIKFSDKVRFSENDRNSPLGLSWKVSPATAQAASVPKDPHALKGGTNATKSLLFRVSSDSHSISKLFRNG